MSTVPPIPVLEDHSHRSPPPGRRSTSGQTRVPSIWGSSRSRSIQAERVVGRG